MSLDAELKLKLAGAARDLAGEIEAGTGPALGTGMQFYPNGQPCCAMGHVYARAGIQPVKPDWSDTPTVGPEQIQFEAVIAAYPVENANDALSPWFADKDAAARTPLPQTLRDYAFAIEGL